MPETQVKTRPSDRIRPTLDAPVPETAMILAAGLGKRMRPLTDDRPKPMVEWDGRPLIDHIVEKLDAAGVKRLVVNLHYKGDVLKDHLSRSLPAGMSAEFSEESHLLDTGGGVKNALPLLGDDPFFVINGDALWRDGTASTLARLAQQWRDAVMDALLLMVPTVYAFGYDGLGDFTMAPGGQLSRRLEGHVSPFVFGGVQIVHPRLFAEAPDGPFSMNLLWDRAMEAERLYGARHEGLWTHVSTPETLEALGTFDTAPLR